MQIKMVHVKKKTMEVYIETEKEKKKTFKPFYLNINLHIPG